MADEILFGPEWDELTRKERSKLGYLTPSQVELRRRRDVYTPGGTPDATVVRGIYKRAMNYRQTWLNARSVFSTRCRLSRRMDTQWDHYERWGTMQIGRVEPVWMIGSVFDDTEAVSALDDHLTPHLSLSKRRQLSAIDRTNFYDRPISGTRPPPRQGMSKPLA